MITILIILCCLACLWTGFFMREIFNKIIKEPEKIIIKKEDEPKDEIPIPKQWNNVFRYNGVKGVKGVRK